MLWAEFSRRVRVDHCASDSSEQGTIAALLRHRGFIQQVACCEHTWYPAGTSNDQIFNGYRYVDINNSFYGTDPVLIAEASCCMIVVLIDPASHTHFCAHISAASDLRSRLWFAMKIDLSLFFKKIDFDIQRTELYLFCNNNYKNQQGRYEQDNFMKLFNSVLDQFQMRQLTLSTWLIAGEAGYCWNPYCSVCLGNDDTLQVIFACEKKPESIEFQSV